MCWQTILSVKELLKAFPVAQVARALNLKPSRVTEWQARGTIPAVFHKVLSILPSLSVLLASRPRSSTRSVRRPPSCGVTWWPRDLCIISPPSSVCRCPEYRGESDEAVAPGVTQ